ncbi:MAG TPA: hypothetical protein DIS77_01110, partial [Rothia sp.]|nr:hypothetical protein [Rothia sp. (in: high G+C Gram-positive bacteria)]
MPRSQKHQLNNAPTRQQKYECQISTNNLKPHQKNRCHTSVQPASPPRKTPTLLTALAHLFEVSQPTVSRTIKTIEKALEKVPTPLTRPLKESLKASSYLVVDGTLVPLWNWRSLGKTNFSGKHKRAGFNHQVICTLDGRLLAITDPLPGSRHDAHAFRAHGLDQLLDSSTLADKGYVGLGLTTPTKRRPGLGLLREQKTNNRVLNRLRSVVERVIAQVKTWRILHTGFR